MPTGYAMTVHTGQNATNILGVSTVWVTSRSQKLTNIKWNNVLYLVR